MLPRRGHRLTQPPAHGCAIRMPWCDRGAAVRRQVRDGELHHGRLLHESTKIRQLRSAFLNAKQVLPTAAVLDGFAGNYSVKQTMLGAPAQEGEFFRWSRREVLQAFRLPPGSGPEGIDT